MGPFDPVLTCRSAVLPLLALLPVTVWAVRLGPGIYTLLKQRARAERPGALFVADESF